MSDVRQHRWNEDATLYASSMGDMISVVWSSQLILETQMAQLSLG